MNKPDQKPEKLCTRYGIAVFAPCTSRDPKTCYTFIPKCTLRTDGQWDVSTDTNTLYFGTMGPAPAQTAKKMGLVSDFNDAFGLMYLSALNNLLAFKGSVVLEHPPVTYSL